MRLGREQCLQSIFFALSILLFLQSEILPSYELPDKKIPVYRSFTVSLKCATVFYVPDRKSAIDFSAASHWLRSVLLGFLARVFETTDERLFLL